MVGGLAEIKLPLKIHLTVAKFATVELRGLAESGHCLLLLFLLDTLPLTNKCLEISVHSASQNFPKLLDRLRPLQLSSYMTGFAVRQ